MKSFTDEQVKELNKKIESAFEREISAHVNELARAKFDALVDTLDKDKIIKTLKETGEDVKVLRARLADNISRITVVTESCLYARLTFDVDKALRIYEAAIASLDYNDEFFSESRVNKLTAKDWCKIYSEVKNGN